MHSPSPPSLFTKQSLLRGVFFIFLALSPALHGEVRVASGQTIAFLGDSITEQGHQNDGGYVQLVQKGLAANGFKTEMVPAGISGHKSNQMLQRLQKDVLDKDPDWMTLSCGVNDVWHQSRGAGVLLPEYKKNITEILDRCSQAGVKVMILTATPIMEIENDKNQMLAPYNEFLREIARERSLPLADLNAAFWKELENPRWSRSSGNYLTVDGVHMNPLGNVLLAEGVLKGFGLDEAQMEKAREAWMKQTIRMEVPARLTLSDYLKLNALAAGQQSTVRSVLMNMLPVVIEQTLSSEGKNP